MTAAPFAHLQTTQLSTWLISAYIVALLTLPADFGPRVGGVVFSVARIVLLAAIVVAVIDWRAHLAAARMLPRAVWLGWLAFLGSALVTAALFPSVASWARYGALILEGAVVFLLAYRVALAPNGLRTLAVATVGTTVATAGVALGLAAFGQDYDRILSGIAGIEPVPETSTRFGFSREAGPFRRPLYFGIWMAVASALLLPWMAMGPRRPRWLASTVWLLLLAAVTMLTTSRVAVTTMFVLPGAYFFLRGRRATGVAFLGLSAVVAVAFSALTLDTEGALPDTSIARLEAIRATLDAVRIHPLFGWGLLTDVPVVSGILGERNYVDNVYLSFLVELGILGTAAFVYLLGTIVVLSIRAWSSALGLALGIALIGDLALGFFASTFKGSQGYAALFVLAALALAAALVMRSDARDYLIASAQTPAPPPQRVADIPAERRDRESEAGA